MLFKLRMIAMVLLIGIGFMEVYCSSDEDDKKEEVNLFLSNEFLNIAHRGGRSLRPEETMEAYQHCISVGADVLEMDVHSTSDGVIVLMHDATVDRTTNGTGLIKEMTFEQIRALDAGYNFTTDSGITYPYRGTGLVVPTLEEIFTAFSDQYIVLEIKQSSPPIVDDVMALIYEYALEEKIILGSFLPDVMLEIRTNYPDIFTSYSTFEVIAFLGVQAGDTNYTPPAEFLQVPIESQGIEVLNPAFAAKAKSFGLKIHAWTINDEQEMIDLINMGVDGIITDNPLLLSEVIQQMP